MIETVSNLVFLAVLIEKVEWIYTQHHTIIHPIIFGIYEYADLPP